MYLVNLSGMVTITYVVEKKKKCLQENICPVNIFYFFPLEIISFILRHIRDHLFHNMGNINDDYNLDKILFRKLTHKFVD